MSASIEIILYVGIFLTVVAGVLTSARSLERSVAVRRRLEDAPVRDSRSVVKGEAVRHPLLQWVEAAFLTKPEDRAKLKSDLKQAGFDHPSAPACYVAGRFGLAIGLPLLFVFYNSVSGGRAGALGIFGPLVLAGLGLLGPKLFIQSRASSRRTVVEQQFPDVLDLMLVCVEAGLGVEAAFQRVARETEESHPEVSAELNALSHELAAGRGRAEALRAFGDRLDVPSLKAFVALVVQTEALGVSIAQSLRTYAAEMRETRYLRAEEKAMRIPVLMTLPLVACFMPVTVVALLLPTTIDIIRTVLPSMSMTLR